ncbi:MAG: ABC transporter permease [Actinobacteria bacterium 13_2_20CM_2_72_6]|nr:MAG: ABC transporter permease [Actinobacteria bacterium 13_2_20CM_2_72_6]
MTTVTEVSAVSSASTGAEPSARARLRRRRLVIRASQLALVVVFVGGWELAVRARLIDEFTYGRPSGVVNQLKTWFLDGTEVGSLGKQVWVTMEETLIGFAIGVSLGIVLGVLLGRIPLLADIFDPFIKMMNSIPRIVLGSIFILWFGLGLLSKVILVIVLVFFAVFFNAFQGAREVDRNLIANARILGASPRKVTWQVVVPSAMTWIIASLHIAFGFALIGAIVGEFIGSQQGLGLLINEARGAFNPNGVYAAMLIIAVIALAAEWLITRLERRLLRWRPSQLPSSPDI